MFDILSLIPGKRKLTSSGWYSFNAICCGHLGHKADRRSRGGIKFDGQNNWSYHCFNCGYKCNFSLGKSITEKTRQFLNWCGIDKEQVQRWSLESLKHKDLLDFTKPKKLKKVRFEEHTLPENSVPIDIKDPSHTKFVEYLTGRGIDPSSYPFLVTPNDPGRNNNRIIIPYTYRDKIVGCTSRFLDDRIPRYLNEQQQGYVFGYDFQKRDWQICILVEGVFDALSIDGCAVLHDDISDVQAQLLAQLNRQIIVVPDYDKTGLKLIDRALELGYSVSLPPWEAGIKDLNDAVRRYGKLPVLLSIIQHATNSKIKLELRKKQIAKGI
jgi:hypothetical protein